MSHIFDTLRRLEDERGGSESRVPSEAVDLLGLAERKFPPQSETAFKAPTGESLRPTASQEARLRIVGLPLMVGGWNPASLLSPVGEPPVLSTPLPPVPAEASAAGGPQLKFHQEVTAPIQPERSLAGRAEESPFKDYQEVTASMRKEVSGPDSVELPVIKLPARLQRTVAVLRVALPFVQRILPLLDGHIGTTVSNFLAPYQPTPPAPALPPVDLTPIEDTLAEFRTQHHELHDQVVEQNASLGRIDNQLEMVREATGRNTRELQELIEELKGVSNKINFVALVALGLLAVSVATDLVLYLRILKVLP